MHFSDVIPGLLDDFLTRDGAAAELKKDPRTLARWEGEKIGPPITYIGRTPLYHIPALKRWITSQERSIKPPDPPRRGRPRKTNASAQKRNAIRLNDPSSER
jgi:hypothetical protein